LELDSKQSSLEAI